MERRMMAGGDRRAGPPSRTRGAARAAVVAACALVLISGPRRAAAEYLCQPLDVPGSTFTQVWQLNDVGAIAALADLGAFVYSGGGWTQLPAPPADSGFTAADLGALGINDSGVVAGVAASPVTGATQGFILTGTTYQFFAFDPQRFPSSEARAISDAGIVTGSAFSPDGTGTAFVFNPGAAGPYAQGFTEIVPVLDGVPSFQTIPGQMDGAFRFVGSAIFAPGGRFAFLYDPARPDPFTFFQIQGLRTSARGLNDRGDVVGFVRQANGIAIGFRSAGAGGEPVELITCPSLPAFVDLAPESINEDGVVSGSWVDVAGTNHGFIAYPSPALPQAIEGGAFVFDIPVVAGAPVFLDPAPAVGYRYATGPGDPRFTAVRLPIGIGDDVFTVLVEGAAFTLAAGQELDFGRNGFPRGVTGFEVMGIEPAANLDPASPTAFVTQVRFGDSGRFTGTMRPLTAADELADLADAAADVGPGKSLTAKARAAGAAFARGDARTACAALRAFRSEVDAQSGKSIGATLARALDAEAAAIAGALGCP